MCTNGQIRASEHPKRDRPTPASTPGSVPTWTPTRPRSISGTWASGGWPYVLLDATYRKTSAGDEYGEVAQVVSQAVVVATGALV